MKKIVFPVLIALGFTGIATAQAYEGAIQYDKKKQRAIMIDYAYPPEAVENAIVQKLERLGYKAKEEKGFLNKDKGFLVYRNAYVTDISDDKMDYIIKVERKSRKESDESVLYIILNKNGENVLETLDANDVGRAKSFLNNMLPDIEVANLELQIKSQEEAVAKSEKKLKGLQEEQVSLEKKLDDNQKAQVDTQKDIEGQKQTLEVLRGKRKTN